jgi:serine/threonine protein kinase
MRSFDHKNVVKVFGIATQEEPMMLILELCTGGTLVAYLKNNPKEPTDQLVEFARDACRGMCYLSTKKVCFNLTIHSSSFPGDPPRCCCSKLSTGR